MVYGSSGQNNGKLGNSSYNTFSQMAMQDYNVSVDKWYPLIIQTAERIRRKNVNNYNIPYLKELYDIYDMGQPGLTTSQIITSSTRHSINALTKLGNKDVKAVANASIRQERASNDIPAIINNAVDAIVSSLWTTKPNFTARVSNEPEQDITREVSAALRELEVDIRNYLFDNDVRSKISKYVRNLLIYGGSVSYNENMIGTNVPNACNLAVIRTGNQISFASWIEYFDVERVKERFGQHIDINSINTSTTGITDGMCANVDNQVPVNFFCLAPAYRPLGREDKQYFCCIQTGSQEDDIIFSNVRDVNVETLYSDTYWTPAQQCISYARDYSHLLSQLGDAALPVFFKLLGRGLNKEQMAEAVMATSTTSATVTLTHANQNELLIPALNATISLRGQLVTILGGLVVPQEESASRVTRPIRRTQQMNMILPRVIRSLFDPYLVSAYEDVTTKYRSRYQVLGNFPIELRASLPSDEIEAQSKVQNLLALQQIAASSGLPLSILPLAADALGVRIIGDINAATQQAQQAQQQQQLAQQAEAAGQASRSGSNAQPQ